MPKVRMPLHGLLQLNGGWEPEPDNQTRRPFKAHTSPVMLATGMVTLTVRMATITGPQMEKPHRISHTQ